MIQISNAEDTSSTSRQDSRILMPTVIWTSSAACLQEVSWEHPPKDRAAGEPLRCPVPAARGYAGAADPDQGCHTRNLDGDDFPDLVYMFNGQIEAYFGRNSIRVITPVSGADWPSGSRKQILWFQPIAAPARVSLVSADSLRQVVLSDSSMANAGSNFRFVTVPAVPPGAYHIAVETLGGTRTYAGRMAGELKVTGSLTPSDAQRWCTVGRRLTAGDPLEQSLACPGLSATALERGNGGHAGNDGGFRVPMDSALPASGRGVFPAHQHPGRRCEKYEAISALAFDLLTPIQCIPTTGGRTVAQRHDPHRDLAVERAVNSGYRTVDQRGLAGGHRK